jgi:DnaA family protein
MTQPQVPLELWPQGSQSLQNFMGHPTLVEALSEHLTLPQFVYLWGEHCTGKTHVVRAFEQHLSESGHTYLSLDDGMLADLDVLSQLPDGLEFLLVDDGHQLQNITGGEVALFNTYNQCRAVGCRLLITADCSNRSDRWQLPDLRSRLNSGLTFHLDQLTGEAALSCLQQQFRLAGIPLDPAVTEYLRNHQNTRFQHLYRLFRHLASESLVRKRKVTIPLVRETLEQMAISES